ncbi:MAG: alpha-L-glutamate ligase-like protein [Rhodocyclaceae bacterium]
MIVASARSLARCGVLGINARNADYIARHNPRRAYPLVDDKLLTKELAHRHGIPTPVTHHVVGHYGDLSGLDAAVREHAAFVVKPARGSGGSGIVLVTGRGDGGFLRSSGKALSNEALRYHVSDILSGIHSLEGREDRAIVEALVEPDSLFAAVSFRGVPDLRIVVYRGIPVLAMVRLPTRASDGKANLHQGALGAGVAIHSGITLDAVHRDAVVDRHPDTGEKVAGIRVPHWPEILRMAALASDMTGLGYLGADIVIDRVRGPLLLELNARPGLAIQLANRSGLAHRLARVDANAQPDGKPAE